jgi:hypothetical protein
MPPVRRPGSGALTRRDARILWSAGAALLALAVTATVAAAAAIPAEPAAGESVTSPTLVAAALVALDLGMAYLVPWHTRRRAAARRHPDTLAAVQTIAAAALALGAGLACCAFFFVTREPLLLPLLAPCAAVLLHWHPSEARWVALGGSRDPPRRHRMMRG